ncbi:hypothetical protein Tco_1253256 [Tanacetum coccineum]
MSSPNRSTSDIEDAFSSMNILNYTSVSSDYFPASSGSISFNSLENSKDNMIPPVFSSFYNNPYLKDVFFKAKCADEYRVTHLSNSTLTDDALSWWNAYAQLIGIEQANKITWIELKRLLTNKYCPRTEVKKMEDEFYNLVVKGNDLKTYIRITKYERNSEEAINISQRVAQQKHGRPITHKFRKSKYFITHILSGSGEILLAVIKEV